MTAQLVTEFGRDPFDPTLYFGSAGVDGDIHIREVDGQLWERIAEMGHAGVVNSPNYTPRIADAYRHTVMHADGRVALGMDRRGSTGLAN